MLKQDNGNLVFVTIEIVLQVLSVILVILAKSYNEIKLTPDNCLTFHLFFKIQSKHSDWIIALIHTDHFSQEQSRWKSAILNT